MGKADIFSKVCCTQSLINFIANCPPRVLLPSLLRITNLAKCSSGGRVWKFRDFARIRPLSLAATLHLRSNINFSLHIFATEILGHIFNNFNQIHVGSFLRNKQLNFFESINSKSLYVQWHSPPEYLLTCHHSWLSVDLYVIVCLTYLELVSVEYWLAPKWVKYYTT